MWKEENAKGKKLGNYIRVCDVASLRHRAVRFLKTGNSAVGRGGARWIRNFPWARTTTVQSNQMRVSVWLTLSTKNWSKSSFQHKSLKNWTFRVHEQCAWLARCHESSILIKLLNDTTNVSSKQRNGKHTVAAAYYKIVSFKRRRWHVVCVIIIVV